MKIGILHLSDFHFKSSDYLQFKKIDKLVDSLSILDSIDEFVIVCSGDLANSGSIDDYGKARLFFNRLLNCIKSKYGEKYIYLLVVPGNHDLDFSRLQRDRKAIQDMFDHDLIEAAIPDELNALDNFYQSFPANQFYRFDKIFEKRFCNFKDYKIQFNLVNTAIFSTLQPDDKQIHFFPKSKMHLFSKNDSVNLCITVMHHNVEWFNWNCKHDLEKSIYDNSEILLTGHDHYDGMRELSINNGCGIWISSAGSIDIGNITHQDSYNVLVIDTDTGKLCGYEFVWNYDPINSIYFHKDIVINRDIENKHQKIMPLPSFQKSMKEDMGKSLASDFNDYFVFPKLRFSDDDNYGKIYEVSSYDEFMGKISSKKHVYISGGANSGKTLLLKFLYNKLLESKIPVFWSIHSTKAKVDSLIKNLFSEQYGNDALLYEHFLQSDISKRVMIIDNWDSVIIDKNVTKLFEILDSYFGCIILSEQPSELIDAAAEIENNLTGDNKDIEFSICPFYSSKRHELIRNIYNCSRSNPLNEEDISRINKAIDKLVKNHNSLFALNPDFIIQYTDFFMRDNHYEYQQGEAIFSKIFEFNINSAIIQCSKDIEVDVFITVLEELANYVHINRRDTIKLDELTDIVTTYNNEYGVSVNPRRFLDVSIRSRILKHSTDSFSIYFSNKNYLAYFIARYLMRMVNSEDDYTGIYDVLRNICFGINDNILLFVMYLTNNTRIILSICDLAQRLLNEWNELDLDIDVLSVLKNVHHIDSIAAPTKEDEIRFEEQKEIDEEVNHSEVDIGTRGIYDYDETQIDNYKYRLLRAIKYTEMICKALPAFNNIIKTEHKRSLIRCIYSYPMKITHSIVESIDKSFDKICKAVKKYIDENDVRGKNGKNITLEEIEEYVRYDAQSIVLSILNTFAELASDTRTIKMLTESDHEETSRNLLKLLLLENYGNTDNFMKYVDDLTKKSNNSIFNVMIRRVVRKHLLCTPTIPYAKRQQIIDKTFGKGARKGLLIQSKEREICSG